MYSSSQDHTVHNGLKNTPTWSIQIQSYPSTKEAGLKFRRQRFRCEVSAYLEKKETNLSEEPKYLLYYEI
jgi:hypothetical protein